MELTLLQGAWLVFAVSGYLCLGVQLVFLVIERFPVRVPDRYELFLICGIIISILIWPVAIPLYLIVEDITNKR